MNVISEALAQALQPVAPPFDWTGIIAAAIIVGLVGYIIWIKRTPGLQFGESAIGLLIASLHNNTTATQAATQAVTATPAITQADINAAVAAAVARLTSFAQTPPAALTPGGVFVMTAAESAGVIAAAAPAPAATAPSLLGNSLNVPQQIEFPPGSGTMVWLYQNQNFPTQQAIIDYDIASAARDANLANIDHSVPDMTPEQIAAAIEAGGDPANRSSWMRPSATYQYAMRNSGMSGDDVNRRINEANGAGNYGIFPHERQRPAV